MYWKIIQEKNCERSNQHWKCEHLGFLFFFFYFMLSLRKSLPVVIVIYRYMKLYFYTYIKMKLTFNHQHIQKKKQQQNSTRNSGWKALSHLPLESSNLPGVRGSHFILKPNPPCFAHLSSRVQNSSGGIRSALPERIVQYFSASCGMSAVSEHIKQGYKFVMRALK